MKKKIEKKYIYLIVIIGTSIFIGLSIKVINRPFLTLPERIIKDSVLSIEKVFNIPFNYILAKIDENKIKNNIYTNYQELLKEKNNIESIKAYNKELEREIDALKQILNINQTLSEFTCLNATVINRNIDVFSNTLTIDKGLKHGIELGQAVTFNGTLIGKIKNVSDFTSTVSILTTTDIDNKISVKINNNDNYIYGIINGYKDGYILVNGIDTNEEIINDTLVTTTGLGGIFPSGIVVGKVFSKTKDNFDLATTILVKSNIDFNDISFVTVLKRDNK